MSKQPLNYAIGTCSLGSLLIAHGPQGISALFLGADRSELQNRFPNALLQNAPTQLEKLLHEIIQYIENPSPPFSIPLDEKGTDFQRRVWKALRAIPLGSTSTYSAIAQQIGSPKSARAVAQACAANPIAILTPCHRVIRADGSLSGYRWGVDLKKKLLQQEALIKK